ncbi:MAG: indole-3-glycerol phosphate synthase TrpC [Planctomycetota bacterium]|jgi:indole-3-glycerol phosphate synthase|nr:MAG: indole-3-glycerol phosphate synthase TrpC [Planctomycetota bacterium]
MADILDQIVARKKLEVAACRDRVPTAALEGRLSVAPAVRDFFAALAAPGPIKLIAEFKRKSPSAGEIRPGAAIEEVVRGYAAAGASCLSILTDGPGFGGSLVDLETARIAVPLPVLRKEFVVDRYQVIEARAHGADAVLLIAECLDDCHLRSLYREILDLGMTPLVELHDPENLPRVLDLGATLVGINNRDLQSMTTDLDTVLRLREQVPNEVLLVAESGIKTRADVQRLEAAGIAAMLVGESLLKQPDPGKAAAALLGR